MKKYPEEIAEYIASHVVGRTTRQLTVELNEKFSEKYGMGFTEANIKSYKSNHNLKSGTIGGTPKGFSLVYPAGMEEFVRSIAEGKNNQRDNRSCQQEIWSGDNYRKENEGIQEEP